MEKDLNEFLKTQLASFTKDFESKKVDDLLKLASLFEIIKNLGKNEATLTILIKN